MKRHVIVGNSHAAISAVQAIRSVNSEDKVVLISREDCPAYSPMLTPCYLSGSMPYEGMFFCDEAFYQKNKVDTLLGKRVVRVTPKSKSVSLEDGTSISYDTLLVATGSASRVPPIPGTQLPNVFTLWTAEDARKIGDVMRGAETVAIIGAGLIGIDCVNVVMGWGKKVVLIEMLGQVIPQA
ncbi:MAG: FAD-dependent oxidoreductase, partial [Chloroflexota bacterium]